MEPTQGFNRIRITATEHAGYLRFDFHGPYDFEDIQRSIAVMYEACMQTHTKHVLVSFMDLEGNMPDFDRFQLGKQIAETWGGRIKLAGLAPEEKINRFLENTAVNRQARLQVFSDEGDALQWLLKPYAGA